jgi:hypothetical protein
MVVLWQDRSTDGSDGQYLNVVVHEYLHVLWFNADHDLVYNVADLVSGHTICRGNNRCSD